MPVDTGLGFPEQSIFHRCFSEKRVRGSSIFRRKLGGYHRFLRRKFGGVAGKTDDPPPFQRGGGWGVGGGVSDKK